MATASRTWHEANSMPKYPTLQQRIAWHLAHAKYCACREIPAGIAELIKKRAAGSKAGRPGARAWRGLKH